MPKGSTDTNNTSSTCFQDSILLDRKVLIHKRPLCRCAVKCVVLWHRIACMHQLVSMQDKTFYCLSASSPVAPSSQVVPSIGKRVMSPEAHISSLEADRRMPLSLLPLSLSCSSCRGRLGSETLCASGRCFPLPAFRPVLLRPEASVPSLSCAESILRLCCCASCEGSCVGCIGCAISPGGCSVYAETVLVGLPRACIAGAKCV
jgi:hypothetical protein